MLKYIKQSIGDYSHGTKRYELSDKQWEEIKDVFPKVKAGRPPKDNRLMFNAILWLARYGFAWSDLPERFGYWKTVYSSFCKRCDDDMLFKIFHALNA